MKKTILVIIVVIAFIQVVDYCVNSSMIRNYHHTNNICRGEDPTHNSTQTACQQRDILVKKLTNHGFCWGEEDQAEYQKSWHSCK
jgi:hypothetical protein